MTSEQMSQGVELALPWSFSLSTTAFLHEYDGLPDVTWQCPAPAESGCGTPTVDGRAYGLEVFLPPAPASASRSGSRTRSRARPGRRARSTRRRRARPR